MTPNSRNLGVVSDQTLERRRLPRFSLTGEQFRLAANGKVFAVEDLSQDGMALRILDPNDNQLFPIGHVFEGMLKIKGGKYPLRAQVRNLGTERVGCQFQELSEDVQAALKRFLDPAALGAELRPMPAAEATHIWYRGPSGTDLILKRGMDGQYFHMILCVFGTYVQWDATVGLSTGRTLPSQELGEEHGILRFETMLLKADHAADRGKLSVAKTLILSSNLSQDLKNWCVRHLSP